MLIFAILAKISRLFLDFAFLQIVFSCSRLQFDPWLLLLIRNGRWWMILEQMWQGCNRVWITCSGCWRPAWTCSWNCSVQSGKRCLLLWIDQVMDKVCFAFPFVLFGPSGTVSFYCGSIIWHPPTPVKFLFPSERGAKEEKKRRNKTENQGTMRKEWNGWWDWCLGCRWGLLQTT